MKLFEFSHFFSETRGILKNCQLQQLTAVPQPVTVDATAIPKTTSENAWRPATQQMLNVHF